MLRDRARTVEHPATGYFLDELGPANEKVPGRFARVESAHEEIEQARVGHEQLEEQTAQTVSLDETDELIERPIRISRQRHALEDERAKLAKDLPGPPRARKPGRAPADVPEHFLPPGGPAEAHESDPRRSVRQSHRIDP